MKAFRLSPTIADLYLVNTLHIQNVIADPSKQNDLATPEGATPEGATRRGGE